ncbi:MAG TPA: UxaA family hydrolase [Firmicutes bacterium]|jgi:altronate dehydratase|nr:UxaA family hydrolase [Bacillota bacterium]
MSEVLILDQTKDNVAVALQTIANGERVTVLRNGDELSFHALEEIPAGHKLALVAIEKDQTIMKYGYSIGRATQSIQAGQLVHAHNVRSIRGKELLEEGSAHDA